MKIRMLAFSVLCALSCIAKNYTISGPDAPKITETTAIRELEDYLGKRIDGELEIGGRKDIVFHVGDTALAKEQKCLSSDLQDEQWVVKSVGGDVIINGGGIRGVLYGVYHFLEDCCDIHWWSDIEEYVPKASPLALPALDMAGKPAFQYRDVHRSDSLPISPRIAVRNRLNRSGYQKISMELGGSYTYGKPEHCHTFFRYFPEETYLKEHPEYYSLVDGRRIGGMLTGQLCISNDEVRERLLEKLLANIKKDRAEAEAQGVPAPMLYDLSMNDNWYHCQCEKCMAAAEKYNHSGAYLIFLNKIADEIAKQYPELYITTLAYFYTEPPPKGGIRPAKNMIIKLCDTRSNMTVSILDPSNKVFREFVEAWKNIADTLYVWDYSVVHGNYRQEELPLASEFTYGDTYRFYRDNNVKGVFWEHEHPSYADMYELKFFLECKLFEDPYQDADKLIELFMDKYYGAAGKYVLAYRKLIDQARKDNKGFITWAPPLEFFNFITDEDCFKAQELLDQAEDAVADDSVLFKRVRHARAGLDRLILETRSGYDIFHNRGVVEKKSFFDGKPALKRLNESYVDWFRQYDGHTELVAAAEELLKKYNSNDEIKVAPLPEQFKNEQCFDWYPEKYIAAGNTYLCDDPESANGKAMRMDADKNKNYSLPFECGFYDKNNAKNLCKSSYDTLPAEKGYHWFKVGAFKNPFNGLVYVSRAWTTQIYTTSSHLVGKDLEVWVSVKHTGPMFYPDETGESYIYVDRCIFVLK